MYADYLIFRLESEPKQFLCLKKLTWAGISHSSFLTLTNKLSNVFYFNFLPAIIKVWTSGNKIFF